MSILRELFTVLSYNEHLFQPWSPYPPPPLLDRSKLGEVNEGTWRALSGQGLFRDGDSLSTEADEVVHGPSGRRVVWTDALLRDSDEVRVLTAPRRILHMATGHILPLEEARTVKVKGLCAVKNSMPACPPWPWGISRFYC